METGCPEVVQTTDHPYGLADQRPCTKVAKLFSMAIQHKRSTASTLLAVGALSVASLGATAGAASGQEPVVQRSTAQPGVSLYLSAPDVQGSDAPGAVMETFNGSPIADPQLGTWNVSTVGGVSGTFNWNNADVFGGATSTSGAPSTGGSGSKYASVRPGAPVTVQLPGPQRFLGFWWSAGDASNRVTFYNGETEVAVFTTNTITTLLSNPTVTTVGGATVNSADYFGNPVNGGAAGEFFSYLNVVGENGVAFDRLVLSQQGSGGGFELDNIVRSTALVTPSTNMVPGGFIPGVLAPLPLTVTAKPATLQVNPAGKTVLVKKASTSENAKLKVSVRCTSKARGDLRLCTKKVKKSGKVTVRTYGATNIDIRVNIRAVPKTAGSGTKPSTWSRTWRVR